MSTLFAIAIEREINGLAAAERLAARAERSRRGGQSWKRMSVRAVGRTAEVARPTEEIMDGVHNPAKDVPAADFLELCIRQHAGFRVRLIHVLHCPLLFRSGGPFRRRWGDYAAGPLASP